MSDRDDIIDLTIAYTWALDTRQFADLRHVFHPDATADLRGKACNGADEIITRIGRSVARFDATQHIVGNHQVHIDGDTATCRCHLQSQHTKYGLEGGENMLIGGMYLDRLVRTAGGWRIVHREMRQLWAEGNPAVLALPIG